MEHKTYSELKNQFSALSKTIDCVSENADLIKGFFAARSFRRIIVIGSGSSFDIANSVALSANLLGTVPAISIPAGDLMLNHAQYAPLLDDALILALSRSGSTSEIVGAIKIVKENYSGVKAFSVVCVESSQLGAVSDFEICLPWAFDESVCQTRSVSNMYAAALAALAFTFGKGEIVKSLKAVAEEGDDFLCSIEPKLIKIANEKWQNVCVLADGQEFGIAEEAALAFNEICYIPSICKHVLDVRHGPMILVTNQTLCIVHLSDISCEFRRALIADLVKKGACVIVYSDEPAEPIDGVCADISFGKPLSPGVSSLPLLLICQLISYHRAVADGHNPDSPSGLDAWISL